MKLVDKCLNLLYTYLLTNCFFIAEYGEGLAGSLNEGVEVATFELVLYRQTPSPWLLRDKQEDSYLYDHKFSEHELRL